MRLSRRRQKIARGETNTPEPTRRKWIKTWLKEGYDVSEFWQDISGAELIARLDTFTDPPPSVDVEVDVIVPFWEADADLLPVCVEALLSQEHAKPRLHLIADGASFPKLPQGNIIRYKTPGGWGPYRITNSVFHNLEHTYVALNDADDISYPSRLWKQVGILRKFQADMMSSAMHNRVAEGHTREDLVAQEKRMGLIPPGRPGSNAPLGYSINGSRMMTVEVFKRLNGFHIAPCSMDTDFCNRARYSKVPVVDHMEPLMLRRLRENSLSNGQEYGTRSEGRAKTTKIVLDNLKLMQANPTLSVAQRLGSLDVTEDLQPLPAGMDGEYR